MSDQVINGQAAAVENPATPTPQAPAPAGTQAPNQQPINQEEHVPGWQKRINELTATKYQQAEQLDELSAANDRLLREAEYYRSLAESEQQPPAPEPQQFVPPQPPAPGEDPYLAQFKQNPDWDQSLKVVEYLVNKRLESVVKPVQEKLSAFEKAQKDAEIAKYRGEAEQRQRQILTNTYQATAREMGVDDKVAKIASEHVHGEVATMIANTPQFRMLDSGQQMAVIRDMYRFAVNNIKQVFGAPAAQAVTATPPAVPGAAPTVSQMPGAAPSPNPADKYKQALRGGMSRDQLFDMAQAEIISNPQRPG
jgi:hypothetical protein